MAGGRKSYQTKIKKYGKAGTHLLMVKAGSLGGRLSPANFKHDPKRAARVARSRKR